MTDIVFRRPASTATDILFGGPEGEAILGRAEVRMPSLSARVVGYVEEVPVSGVARVRMTGIRISARGAYDNAVLRGPVAQNESAWQSADPCAAATSIAHRSAARLRVARESRWGMAVRSVSARRSAWAAMQRQEALSGHRWHDAVGLGSIRGVLGWRTLGAVGHAHRAQWQIAGTAPYGVVDHWGDMLRTAHAIDCSSWHVAGHLDLHRSDRSGKGRPLSLARRSRWQDAMPLRPGISAVPIVPPGPGPFVGPTDILFRDRWTGTTAIVFGGSGSDAGQIVVPVRRVYLVINDVSLTRVGDGLNISATSLSVSADVDSFQIGFEASIAGSAFDDVMPAPDPVELVATINGTAFRLVVESVSRDRTFGKRSVSISGRGWAAQLADPFAAASTWSNAEARTAQQLAAETLPSDWSLDWMLDDWLVPAGDWSFTGTPAAAVARIADSVGGYVVPGRSSKVLSVRHRYPSAPWDWGTLSADLILPADVTTKEALKVVSKAEYDAVYVSGETAGYLGSVKRAGTAGARQAQMVTDALMTDVLAVRQRGRAILSDTGLQIVPTLDLPVLPETGIIGIGTLVEFRDGSVVRRGLVRSNKVTATMPKVRQSIEVETHA